MKQTKVVMLLAFIFCVSLSFSTNAATENSVESLDVNVKTETTSKKSFSQEIKKHQKNAVLSYRKAKKSLKKFLKEKKENVSSGTLLLLAIVGLGCILLGRLVNVGILVSLGGILILVAVVWWLLQLLGII